MKKKPDGLHELAVNAAKHGALKSRGGKLKVAWQLEEESDDPKILKVTWEEVASTACTPDSSPGYGTGLIDTTIASLGGVVERAHKDGLFVVRFTIPLSEVNYSRAQANTRNLELENG